MNELSAYPPTIADIRALRRMTSSWPTANSLRAVARACFTNGIGPYYHLAIPRNEETFMASSKSVVSGQVGELAVAAELLSRGHIVCAMLPGYPEIDLLVLNKGHNVHKLVQVKYDPGKKPSWLCTKTIERVIDPRLIYVFVCRATPPCMGFDYYCLPEVLTRRISKQQNDVAVARRKLKDSNFVDNDMRRIDLTDPKYPVPKNDFSVFA